jgi:hypothetical protein
MKNICGTKVKCSAFFLPSYPVLRSRNRIIAAGAKAVCGAGSDSGGYTPSKFFLNNPNSKIFKNNPNV